MKKDSTKLIIPILLIALGLIARLLPHPANFAPIGAIALFSALYLPRKYALVIPLVAMFISDIFIGFYSLPIMLSVYSGFIIMGMIGLLVKRNNHSSPTGKKILNILSGTLVGSILFFLLTNLAVWAFGTMYTHTFSGLIQSYTMAIPFFKNSLLGDLFYCGIMIGGYEFILLLKTKRALKAQTNF